MRLSKRQLRKGLQVAAPPAEMRGKDAFWADFQARSRDVPQLGADGLRRDLGALFRHPWGILAGATAMLLAGGILARWLLPDFRPPPMAVVSTVEEIDVFTECSSVLVFEDADNRATLVWLAGLDVKPANTGDADYERF